MANKNFRAISLVSLIISLPLLIWAVLQVTNYLSNASIKKANIVVDTTSVAGTLTGRWQNFAQGGEEPPPMLTSAVESMKLLKPRYIRLDHIYDYFGVVKEDGSYDFSRLDSSVDDILKMGARPFLSLTYMPRQFTDSKSVIDAPRDWNLWQDLVRATIERYSGVRGKNIVNVYYEVWNEPDLPQFGGWKLTGNKNYNTLYHYAANGAAQAVNTNRFFLGGPAVGSYYPEWVDKFLTYVRDNNLRLDFYSWHRYHTDPNRFREDAEGIRKLLNKYPGFKDIPLALTEWGIDSEKNGNSSTDRAAAHALATIFKTHDVIAMPFAFEVKDGPPPDGGKWGLITHERDVSPLFLKPRFKAFSATNFLVGPQLQLTGDGSKVTAMASRGIDGTIYVLLVNYDARNTHFENVPVTITGLTPGQFSVITRNITAAGTENSEATSTDGKIIKEIAMLPNTIRLLEIKKSGNLQTFISGESGLPGDRAIVLSGANDLKIDPFAYDINGTAAFKFSVKTLNIAEDLGDYEIATLEVSDPQNNNTDLSIRKMISKNIHFLLLSGDISGQELRLAAPLSSWDNNSWHTAEITFDGDLTLTVDGNQVKTALPPNVLSRLSSLNFYPRNIAVDNISVSKNGLLLFRRDFN